MKLTQKLKAEILKTYNAYWDSFFQGDMRAFAARLDKNAQIIGSSEDEIFSTKASAVKFYKATAGQVAGKTALRNRKIGLRPVGNGVMITERSDFYALIDGEWTFYGHGRISTLMRKTGKTWKIIYEHGSLPDAKAGEGEQINTERIKAENLQLRDAVKRRTIELEQKNRELEIETALERIRAVAMGMKEPADMLEICRTISQQLELLHIKDIRNVQTAIFYESNGCYLNYEYFRLHEKTSITTIDYNLQPDVKAFVNQMLTDPEAFFTIAFHGAKLKKWIEYQQGTTQFVDPKLHEAKSLHYYFYSIGPGALGLSTYNTPLREEDLSVLKRFRNVFELAYRRFIDIELAIAQARQAQIEAALERVRTKAMAMHKSADLKMAVATVFEELEKLNLGTARCGIGILNKEKRSAELWTTSKSEQGSAVHVSGDESMDIHPLLQGAFNAWLQQGDFSYLLQGEDLADYYRALRETNFRLPESQSLVEHAEKLQQHYYVATFQAGGLFAFRETAFPEEAKAVLRRFAGVFNLTYKRFLDIQKAEAQAREAQIEAALERIRSRALGMRHSSEVGNVTELFFSELENIGINVVGCSINVLDKTGTRFEHWRAKQVAVLKEFESYSYQEMMEQLQQHVPEFTTAFAAAWKSGKPFYKYLFAGEARELFFAALSKLYKYSAQQKQEMMSAYPDPCGYQTVFFERGFLRLTTTGLLADADLLLCHRFTDVFDFAYTRFLDLKQAEEQAREAQIEVALERVRSRSLAMHKSEELQEVVTVVFERMRELDIAADSINIGILKAGSKDIYLWTAAPRHSYSQCFHIPYVDLRIPADIYEARAAGVDLAKVYTAEEKNSYFAYTFEHTDFRHVPKERKKLILEAEAYALSVCFTKNAAILAHRYSSVQFSNKENEVLKRFANVFEQTYTRFLDLQKAEAHAREAQIEAALERVRAEIASMRTAADLQRITPLIWRELTTLGVPFFRCGIFIIDEAHEYAHVYLSTPSGEAVAALHLRMESAPLIRAALQHWRQQQIYREEWNREQFVAWTQSILKQGLIESSEKYQAGNEPPEKLVLQFVPFTQGMLYIGSRAALSHEEIELCHAIAKAFGMAYARYEDFQRLEQAKKEIEAALENLKRTQSQLIQSEKMASLGQLTAGIAHEIKNPLNFVNNFAALSVDLAKELREEIAKIEDGGLKIEDSESRIVDRASLVNIEEILHTLEQNAEKISHHGKRADDIVKSMMQHARGSSGQREMADLNLLLDEAVNLTYHSLRAKDASFSLIIEKNYDDSIGQLSVVPQDISRVFLNIVNNAAHAAHQKKKENLDGFSPTLSVQTKNRGDKIEIRIRDNGNGIPLNIRDKIFNPFFTTKPAGQGTGLGLSISYDIIVQEHKGEIKVESEEGKFTEFVLRLPPNS